MSQTAIQIQDLSKLYRLGVWSSSTLRDDFLRYWAKLRGKSDPTASVASVNKLDTVDQDYVWALRNIDLEVKQGEVMGIIGKNGAGKSTLLKILSQITGPTEGKVKMKGKVASLLEVGTGMHQELTGRENVFLNGAILGMRKQEVRQKFNEITDFSGIAKYLDTPIKRYSSGMRVRLGFAIAAFLDPNILIVDEVLAVGDAEFQKRAIGKMKEVSKGEGRTVLFVSHNMNSVRSLCNTGILLINGKIAKSGSIHEVVNAYEENSTLERTEWISNEKNPVSNLKSIRITDAEGSGKSEFLNTDPVFLEFTIENHEPIAGVKIGFDLIKAGSVVFRSQQVDSLSIDRFSRKTNYTFTCQIPSGFLNAGQYSIRPLYSIHGIESLISIFETILSFRIRIDGEVSEYHTLLNEANHPGVTFPFLDWKYETHS